MKKGKQTIKQKKRKIDNIEKKRKSEIDNNGKKGKD